MVDIDVAEHEVGAWQRPVSPVPPRAPRRRGPGRPGAVVLACALAGLVGGWAGTELGARSDPPPRRPSMLGVEVAAPRTSEPPAVDVAHVAARIGPSVVAIQRPIGADGTGESTGTGVVLTTDGEIVTNAHVVGDASTVNVRLPGESEPRVGSVLAVDPAGDLALVRIGVEGLTPAVLAAPGDLRVGDDVVAIGFSLDLDGDPSVTKGIVSGLDRTLATRAGVLDGLVQTDAAISSGNSGGPLVDADGRVVGLTTAVAYGDGDTAANSVGFAIGVAELLPEIADLRAVAAGIAVPEGYLGVGLEPRRDGGRGAVVALVEAGSPADIAGLRRDDVVVAIDGVAVLGDEHLMAAVRDLEPGAEVVLALRRDGTAIERRVVLGARAPD